MASDEEPQNIGEDKDRKYDWAGENSQDPSSYKRFPKKPGLWDKFKEGFQPTNTRAMLDALRKRREPTQD